MPFSSLFSRKGSRKNQSKDKSGQISQPNHPSEDTTKEDSKSESIPGKKGLSHAVSASQEESKVEEKTFEGVNSTLAKIEAPIPQDIQAKHSGNENVSNDNCSGVENGVGQLKENKIQKEDDKNLSRLAKSSTGGSSECVDETGSCPDSSGQGHEDCTITHSTSVPISHDGDTGEENQLNTRNVTEQSEFVSEKHTTSDEPPELKDTGITVHEDPTEEIISNMSQNIDSEDSDAGREGRLKKSEGTEVKICDLQHTPSHPPTAEVSNVETVVFSELNNSEEPQTRESVVNVSESKSANKISSVAADIHEPETGNVVTNCSNNTDNILPAKTVSENQPLKDDESANTEDETEEKINVDTPPPEEILSDSNSIGDLSDIKKNDLVIEDSQTVPDKEQSVVTKSENMKVQSCPPGMECEGVFKEITSLDEKSNNNNEECEFESASEKDLNDENYTDRELWTQARSSNMGQTSEDKDSTEKSLNFESAEHDTEKAQDNEIVSKPPLSATNISLVISNAASTNEKSETQTMMDMSHQNTRNSDQSEQKETKEANDVDSSIAEVLESNSVLTEDEENEINYPQDCAEIPSIESTSPLEDSFDSFPSGCEDFLGGQRTLMASEHHQPPSWKVGYLQVKQPVKSRGRGKLKVWRQRWVVMQMDEFVKDSQNPSLMINIYASECSNARRHSALFFCTVSASKTVVYRSQSKTHKYAFSISVDNDVVLHLAADSETASQEWMTAIRNLLWPPSPVLQLEKVLHGSDFEVSIIDNEFSFHAGLLGTYGNMKVTSNKLILSHPQTDHVIQEWYLNTLDKFQLLAQSKEEDAFKVVIMHTGGDSSTGSGQIILFCPEAVTMLQSIASTIHKLLQYRTTSGKDHNQKELADLAEWLSPIMSQSSTRDPPEDYYKIPRRQIRSLLDIPNFSFEKPLSNEGLPQSQESVVTKPSMLTSATSASTFSEDSGISMAIQPDDFLNCSITSFTIGGRPVRDRTSSESSDGYSPPCTPEIERKEQQTT